MPAPNHRRQPMSSTPPTAKQLAYLRRLAERTGKTFATPRTSRDASARDPEAEGLASREPARSGGSSAMRSQMQSTPERRTASASPGPKSPGTALLRPGGSGHDAADRHRESDAQQRRRRSDRARPIPHRRRRRTRALRPARCEGGARHRRPGRPARVVPTSSSVDSRRMATRPCSRWSPTISRPPIGSASHRCPQRSWSSRATGRSPTQAGTA